MIIKRRKNTAKQTYKLIVQRKNTKKTRKKPKVEEALLQYTMNALQIHRTNLK